MEEPVYWYLPSCSDEQFEHTVEKMDLQGVISAVSVLQKEMAKEQQHFNDLTVEMNAMPKDSPEHKKISTKLLKSQNKLAMLMSRNMQCFAKQAGVKAGKPKENSSGTDQNKNLQSVSNDTKVRSNSAPIAASTNQSAGTKDEDKSYIPDEIRNFYQKDIVIIESNGNKEPEVNGNDISLQTKTVNNIPKKVVPNESTETTQYYATTNLNDADTSALNDLSDAEDSPYTIDVDEGDPNTKLAEPLFQEDEVTLESEYVNESGEMISKDLQNQQSKENQQITVENQQVLQEDKENGERKHKIEVKVDLQTAAIPRTEQAASAKKVELDSANNLQNVKGDTQTNGSHSSTDSGLDVGYGADGGEKIKPKVTLKEWSPEKLLKELYTVKLETESENSDVASNYITMEGYMEKLPMGKKKATLLKTWKRRYFKTFDGNLYYYDSNKQAQPSGYMQLMGGSVDDLGTRLLGVDDGRGRYLMVRCPSDKECQQWKQALESQIVDNMSATYVKPVAHSMHHHSKNVVVMDLGSCSVRAGVLGNEPSLPQIFFPCVVAIDKNTGNKTYGVEAFEPATRGQATLAYPIKASIKVDKFTIDMDIIPGLFEKIFQDLKVDPSNYWIMMSVPQNCSAKIKEMFVKLLVDDFGVQGVNIVGQAVLALYSYNTTSGIAVDIGDRIDILPITDGYIVDGGVTRQPFGGQRIGEALNAHLTEQKYRFFTEVETLIVRYVMEKTCYVAHDYNQELVNSSKNIQEYKTSVDLTPYGLPEGTYTNVDVDVGRFTCVEGLLNTDLWGMDNPTIQKLIHKAIQACPMDTRREMCRGIYLSGGATLIPGFTERLTAELSKMVPPSIVIQVHAAPNRYHSAYIGACALANMNIFEQACITQDEWKTQGSKALKKWQNF